MREQPLEVGHLDLEPRVSRLRLLPDAFEAPLDVVAVGDEELELQRLEVVRRNARAREPVEDDKQGVDLAQIAEQLRAPYRERRRRAPPPA